MAPQFEYEYIPYQNTGKFTQIVLDYLSGADKLSAFYDGKPDLSGIKKAIENRKKHPVNRALLVQQLSEQYAGTAGSDVVMRHIKLLSDENTFTICTAHQPNLFTGHLYFIYKIMHVIKLADQLAKDLPGYQFVPVFFMGSEDADLAELNHIILDGKKYTWKTNQQGAVGKMVVDDALLKLLPLIEGRLLAEPFGIELSTILKDAFRKGRTIEQSTFLFVHALFRQFGLVVFLPDNPAFKSVMIPVFRDDLFLHKPAQIVSATSDRLSAHYSAQAFVRDINLFYMKGDLRNRIIKTGDRFVVHETDIAFSEPELRRELEEHPGRFSPNVILRGLFQEQVLPDIAFIGGGGELAYWLQLKDLFEHYQTPYPVLFLRNSFTIIDRKWREMMVKLGLTPEAAFEAEELLLQRIIRNQAATSLSVDEEKQQVSKLYDQLSERAQAIDPTLVDHIAALKAMQLKRLRGVERKFVSAEKKKHAAVRNQLNKLLTALARENGLQERSENFMLFYAKWGHDFLDELYKASPVYDPEFCMMIEK